MSDLVPDMAYQKGGPLEFPAWVPCVLPAHAESLCEQVTEAFRGEGHGTTNLHDLFSDERRELEHAFTLEAAYWQAEIPL